VTCWLRAGKLLRRRSQRPVRLSLSYGGADFQCVVAEYSQLSALREVLAAERYAPPSDLSPRTIVDLGSNIGASVIYFRLRYPDARIAAVEPDRTTFDLLRRNTERWGNITLHNVAVGGQDGRRPFFESGRSWASSLIPEQGWSATEDGGSGPVDSVATVVTVRSLESLLRELDVDHVDLLKFDVEGAEWELFDDFEPTRRVAVAMGELHWDTAAPRADEWLSRFGGYDVTLEDEGAHSHFLAVRRPVTAGQPDT
jgi:FkbM family methyltransferase